METETPAITDILQTSLGRDKVGDIAAEYVGFHDEKHGGTVEERKRGYTRMVNDYYDLVTDFYEFGWGKSFHFAPAHRGESFEASIARHEMWLALQLGLKPGMKVLDVGCGVGGPMRTIARFSGASVTGINNNDYQIARGREQTRLAGLDRIAAFLKADFMKLPVQPASIDAAYAIEATCHAPDKVGCYGQIFKALKPGAEFAGYEWCLTDLYDPNSAEHRAIKKGIEEGDALPDLVHTSEVTRALKAAGFEVLEARDLASESDAETPWHLPLAGQGVQGLVRAPLGRWLTHQAVSVLEKIRLAPKGTIAVSSFLNDAADALIAGGRTGTFTPMFYFRARKPAAQ